MVQTLFSLNLPRVIVMFLYDELMAHYRLLLLYIFSGMHGSRRLFIIMPGAYSRSMPVLILACLLGVAISNHI